MKKALEIRRQVSKSSLAKLDALERLVSPDGRLRHSYRLYGAHTGRWSAGGNGHSTVQVQNLVRGTIKDVDGAVQAIRNNQDLTPFGPPLEVLSSCLRAAFRAPEGKTLVICDLSQIELRVLAWLTNCTPMLAAFEEGADIYTRFASGMYGVPESEVSKTQRQVAKSAVLGCGFQLSGGRLDKDKNGDEIKTGFWGYSAAMGVSITKEEAHTTVRAFRDAYPEIVNYWWAIEETCKAALRGPGTTKTCGWLKVGGSPGKVLYIELPVGRRLYYPKAEIRLGQWESGDDKEYISFMAIDPITKKYGRRPTWAGRIVENVVQATARDVLAEGMLRVDDAGLEIVLHSHDELGCVAAQCDAVKSLDLLTQLMTEPINWAPGLALKAEGLVTEVYRK